jgi:1,4-alpha-glucan branching enzyme
MVVATLPQVSVSSSAKPTSRQLPQLTHPDQWLTDLDLHLLAEGSHWRMYDKLGAHPAEMHGQQGIFFCVWAPNANRVSVLGDFNGWDVNAHVMANLRLSGYWGIFVPNVPLGAAYKYNVQSGATYHAADKADPVGFFAELRPATGSRVWDMANYDWQDAEWMQQRHKQHQLDSPVSIYEVHLGSWMRVPEDGNRWLSYVELADKLTAYVKQQGYTHVELLPMTEHPFDGSWGYQTVGYFAPTSRFGNPDEFKYLVDTLHQNGIGIIVDWVPAHFPKDMHGLDFFDGTHLYDHDDWRKREMKDWGTNQFNYGRHEVSNFLIANALFWLDKYHIDGLRVDAVASMLYLDYSREDGEWAPNCYGGHDNLEALAFLRRFNEQVYAHFPDVMTFAEESTSFGGVSKPTYTGGLGFGYKWDMGWMHDTLHYFQRDPIHRKYHQNDITFRGLYMFSENFIMPLSHDEVVHGKGALLSKMPGDMWQQFANLRALLGYMFAQPGKKLLFQGADVAQWDEWNSAGSVDWHLLQWGSHKGVQTLVAELNRLYRTEPALHQKDADGTGYKVIDCNDSDNSVFSFARVGRNDRDVMLVVCNFTPATHEQYQVGVPVAGTYTEVLNTDDTRFDGSGQRNHHPMHSYPAHVQWQDNAINLKLAPLSVTFLKLQ